MSETTAETPVATETAEQAEANRVGPMHEAFAAYIKENKGVDITAEQVFAVTSTRVAFRKSDAYLVGVKEAKVNAKAEAEKAREEAKAAKAAEREKAAAEKAEAKKVADAAKAEAKAKADAEKAAKGDSGEALAEANAATGTEKKSGKGKASEKAKTESPF